MKGACCGGLGPQEDGESTAMKGACCGGLGPQEDGESTAMKGACFGGLGPQEGGESTAMKGACCGGLGPQEDGERVRETHRHTDRGAGRGPASKGRAVFRRHRQCRRDRPDIHTRSPVCGAWRAGDRPAQLHNWWGGGGGGLGRGARDTSRLTSSVDVGLRLQ